MQNEQWLDIAKELPMGGKVRVAHFCNTAQDMIVSNGPQGLSAYCFRCGSVGFRPHGKMTLDERSELLKRTKEYEAKLLATTEVKLPDDYTEDIPVQYRGWMDRASITELQQKLYGIGWSHKLHRIVIPIFDLDHNLVYYQARAVLPIKPKYLNPRVPKDRLLFRAGDHKQRDVVVFTEDILSAIRVSNLLPACSPMGCKLSEAQAVLLAQYKRVIIWLDPDEAGLKGTDIAKKQLGLITEVTVIKSSADPKNLSNREIAAHLNLPYSTNYEVD